MVPKEAVQEVRVITTSANGSPPKAASSANGLVQLTGIVGNRMKARKVKIGMLEHPQIQIILNRFVSRKFNS